MSHENESLSIGGHVTVAYSTRYGMMCSLRHNSAPRDRVTHAGFEKTNAESL